MKAGREEQLPLLCWLTWEVVGADDGERLGELLLHVGRHVAHEPEDDLLDPVLVLLVQRRVGLVRVLARVPPLLDQVLRRTERHTCQ